MKKLICALIAISISLLPASVFAEGGTPEKAVKTIIAETGNYIITEEVPPVLNYLGGGNFFLGDTQGFDGGVAVVSVESQPLYSNNGHGGANDFHPTTHNALINTKGEEVLGADYYKISIIGSYIAANKYAAKDGINYYPETEIMYFDKSGKRLETIGDVLEPYQSDDGRVGYKDLKGNIKIKANYSSGESFAGSYAVVWHDNAPSENGYIIQKSIIDRNGKQLFNKKFYDIYNDGFVSGLMPACDEFGLWGYIDKTGEYVIKPSFSNAGAFSEGLAAVTEKESGKAGYIDKDGSFAFSLDIEDFYAMHEFSEGLAVVGGIGYVDKSGNVAIPADNGGDKTGYEIRYPFAGGFASVIVGKKHPPQYAGDGFSNDSIYGLIDKTGELLPLDIYDNVFYAVEAEQKTNGYCIVEKDGKLGIIRVSGKGDYSNANNTGVVTGAATLNVRSGPGPGYPVIGALAKGEEVIVTDIIDNWCEIIYKEKTGFVSGNYMTIGK